MSRAKLHKERSSATGMFVRLATLCEQERGALAHRAGRPENPRVVQRGRTMTTKEVCRVSLITVSFY
jgi:hypothetical protein